MKEELLEKIQSGEITINEARKKKGLPPIEDGDIKITREQCDSNMDQDYQDH